MVLTGYHSYTRQSQLTPSSIIWVKMSLVLTRIWSLKIGIVVFQVSRSRFALILPEWMICPSIPRSVEQGILKNFNLWWMTPRQNLKHKLDFDISLWKTTGSTHTAGKIVHIQTTKCRLAEDFLDSKQHRCSKIWCIDVLRFDVYHESASKGKVFQNISNKKVFQ